MLVKLETLEIVIIELTAMSVLSKFIVKVTESGELDSATN